MRSFPLSLPPRRRALTAIGAALAQAAAPRLLHAQGAAQGRSITWLVGQPAGGSTDVLTRVVAREIERSLGQSVLVDNRPGAAGAIALQAAAKAPADGLTLVSVPGPVLTNTVRPEIAKELAAVASLARGPMMLVGTMASPLPATLAELLAAARKDRQAFSYATSGTGTSQHLAGELLNQIAQTQIAHIPYKGGSQAVTDVVGGQVPLGVLGITPVLPHIRAGRLRAYGISTAARSVLLPGVPSLQEAGLPGFDVDQWFVVAAAAGVPAERIQVLNAAINKALQTPEVKASFAGVGLIPSPASPEQTTAFVAQEMQRWLVVARKVNLRLD